jgi:hypothetical protein
MYQIPKMTVTTARNHEVQQSQVMIYEVACKLPQNILDKSIVSYQQKFRYISPLRPCLCFGYLD